MSLLFIILSRLYAGQETTKLDVDWFQIGKGACQGSILSACLFNYHAEYIRQNARLDDILSQQLFLVTFHAKMGTIKGRNGTDITKAEDIKKR